MTAVDYKALAERLKEHAALHDSLAAHSDEQRQWADDLRTVVSLLREMAHREAVQYAHADGCWTWGPRHYYCALREIDRLTHPAPQPQPIDPHMIAAEDRYPDEPTERSTVSDLERICAESYQVVGWLADECGLFDNESVIKALDNLSEQRLVHEDVLPFAPVERRTFDNADDLIAYLREPTEAQIEAAADVIRPHLHGDADPPSFIAMDALRAALAAKE